MKIIANKKIKWIFISCCALVSLVFLLIIYLEIENKQDEKFKVIFFNVGQGDSALINFGNNKRMLVDCGPDKTILFKLGKYLPLFNEKIDYLVVTHPDLDHYGGCVDVLNKYQVGEVFLNGRTKEYDPYWRIFDQAVKTKSEKQTLVYGYAKLDILNNSRVGAQNFVPSVEFLSPDPNLALPIASADGNNYSIVFKLTSPQNKTFLFTGDMEMPLEQVLINEYCDIANPPPAPSVATEGGDLPLPLAKGRARVGSGECLLNSDVLKIGHHGSNGSSSEDFLNAVKPKIAIISVGKNKYGHPSPRVIKHLERVGAQILRTDQIGDIVIAE